MSTGLLYIIAFALLLLSYVKDKAKTKKALKKALKSIQRNTSMLVTMMTLMGVLLTVIDPALISRIFGQESGLFGVLLGLGVGSVSFMPSFVAFPLGASLLESGAGYPQVAGFISSLMGVGVVSFGVESKYFGAKVAAARNGVALVASIVFVLVVGGVL